MTAHRNHEADTLSDEGREIDLSGVFNTLWRGKLIIALCAIICLIMSTFYAFAVATPIYTASTTVALDSQQAQVVDLDSVITSLSGDQASINTEVEVLRSRGLVGQVADTLDLINDPEFNTALVKPSRFAIRPLIVSILRVLTGGSGKTTANAPPDSRRDAVIDQILASYSVVNIRQSFVFRITVTTTNPEKSAKIANTIAQTYVQDQLETKFRATEDATKWLSSRVAQLKSELETSEREVKSFNADADLVSPQALIALNRQIKDLRTRAAEAQTAEAEAAARISALEAAMDVESPALIVQLTSDPVLTRLAKQIDVLDTFSSRRQFKDRLNDLIEREQIEQSRSRDQSKALRATIELQEERIERQSSDLVVLQQLQREAEANRLIYEFFLGRLKETSVQQGIQRADSRILSQAVVPQGPSAPRKSLIMMLAMVMGLFAGSGIVLLREFSQNTFRDSETLETKTGHTVIGQIPLIPARQRKNVLKYLTDKPTSAAAEAVRNLRTSVLLSNIDNPPQIIMSTSSIPGEGKTTQSLAITQNLTGLNKKVLLIEGDIRRRVFAEYFELGDQKGLLSVLSKETTLEEAIVHEPSLRADMLIGEKATTNAADIFSSERFREFLEELRHKYDYIIIDTPPVLVVPDARVIGQSVDTVIYAVKWDSTTQRQVIDGLKAFETVKVRVSGLVLSQINPRGMKKYGLGEAYGSYGGYYDN